MPTFFFDENIAPGLCGALCALGVDGVHIKDVPELGLGTKDPVWFPVIRDRGWVAVSMDRFKKHQRQDLLSGITAFIIDQAPFSACKGPYRQAAWLLTRWATIETIAAAAETGAHFRVRGGKPPHVTTL